MKIRWTGSRLKRRVIGAYTWGRETSFVQEVADAGLAAELLTGSEPFAVAEDEPLLAISGIGAYRVIALALAGVSSVQALAALAADSAQRIATELAVSPHSVRTWVEQAREMFPGKHTVALSQEVEEP